MFSLCESDKGFLCKKKLQKGVLWSEYPSPQKETTNVRTRKGNKRTDDCSDGPGIDGQFWCWSWMEQKNAGGSMVGVGYESRSLGHLRQGPAAFAIDPIAYLVVQKMPQREHRGNDPQADGRVAKIGLPRSECISGSHPFTHVLACVILFLHKLIFWVLWSLTYLVVGLHSRTMEILRPSPIPPNTTSIPERVWDKARWGLDGGRGVPSPKPRTPSSYQTLIQTP